MAREDVLAWVESPLQLVGAAEWAHAHDRTVPVAGRLTPQMSETADELVARGARFGELEPYVGIPWRLLSRHRHWLVGDGFSGQFRLAVTVLRPRRITFLDDGANIIPFADALLGIGPYARPGVTERGLTATLAPFALAAVLRRTWDGDTGFFTAFDFGEHRAERLRERGLDVRRHSFEWTRRTARGIRDLGTRVILGSAATRDGRMSRHDYTRWVTDAAASAPALYLPHRREPAEQLDAVAHVPNVTVRRTGLPVELVLAGATEPLTIHTLPSSTTTTLPLVLSGTGSTLRIGRTHPIEVVA